MPMCFNIGVIIGPVLGGVLADPVGSYPALFGDNSIVGGKNGVWWMKHWPYALPNLLSAFFLFIAATGAVLGLEEASGLHYSLECQILTSNQTSESLKNRSDIGRAIGRRLARVIRRLHGSRSQEYMAVDTEDPSTETYDLENIPHAATNPLQPTKPRRKLPLSRIWTRNVLFTLLTHAILAFHVGTFNNLWFIFLSTPRFDPEHPSPPDHHRHLPFVFTGGLGMPPRSVGMAMAILGLIGISLQRPFC